MNFPEVIEYAIKETLRRYADDAVPMQWLRSSQMQKDVANSNSRQYFPQIRITASSKFMESEGCTWATSIEAACVTWYEDDADASVRARMYGEVERILDHLVQADPGDEIQAFFLSKVAEHRPTFTLGGMTPEETVPELDGGAQTMAYRGTIHFSL